LDCSIARRTSRAIGLFLLFSWVCVTGAGAFGQGIPGPKGTPQSSAQILSGLNGWLFLPSELRFLQFPTFWGKAALTAARSNTPESADPLPAIVHFRDQLSAAGIRLILVPVPPKALALRANLPADISSRVQTDSLTGFYEQLRSRNVEIVDLLPVLAPSNRASAEMLYCKTDSHWSGMGCEAAAKAIAEALKTTLDPLPKSGFRSARSTVTISGDLAELQNSGKPAGETLSLRQISTTEGKPLQADATSPLLLMGDSHTLVFHEFLAERAGLFDQLAMDTGVVPDLIGTRGSGANAVRVSLLRRGIKDPSYLSTKKVIVWCFAAREFTESDQGWQSITLRK
jgi:alginate O-acetyltransferase complex protein AlgJ